MNSGCSLKIFEFPDFKGEHINYDGPLLLPNPPPTYGYCCDGQLCASSYIWSCKQHFPDCVPSDGWGVITQLDNSQSNIPTKFTFQQTIGKSNDRIIKHSKTFHFQALHGPMRHLSRCRSVRLLRKVSKKAFLVFLRQILGFL